MLGMVKTSRIAFAAALATSIFACAEAYAIGAKCGLDNFANNPCPAPDMDGDGYPSTLQGYEVINPTPFGTALDCDDTDSSIFPGVVYEDGGSYFTCEESGVPTNHGTTIPDKSTGAGSTYYFDAINGDNANPGTLASPKKNLVGFNHTRGDNYYGQGRIQYGVDSFVAGSANHDVAIYVNQQNPLYSASGGHFIGTTAVVLNEQLNAIPSSGVVNIWGIDYNYIGVTGNVVTLATGLVGNIPDQAGVRFHLNDHITFRQWPGAPQWEIDWTGKTYQSEARSVWVRDSSFVRFFGLETYGVGSCFWVDEASDYNEFRGLTIRNCHGNGDNNDSGIVFEDGSSANIVHASIFRDNFDNAQGGNPANNRDIAFFRGIGNRVIASSFERTNGGTQGVAVGSKHDNNGQAPAAGDRAEISDSSLVFELNQATGHAFSYETGAAGSRVVNNYGKANRYFVWVHDAGGPTNQFDIQISDNTSESTIGLFNGQWTDSWETPPRNIRVLRNAQVSNFNFANESGFVNDSPFRSDALYDEAYGTSLDPYNGQVAFDYNCYHNQQATNGQGFQIFRATSAGLSGAFYDFAGWQTQDISANQNKPGFESNGYEQDPLLDADGRVTSANCQTAGAGFKGFLYYVRPITETPSSSGGGFLPWLN